MNTSATVPAAVDGTGADGARRSPSTCRAALADGDVGGRAAPRRTGRRPRSATRAPASRRLAGGAADAALARHPDRGARPGRGCGGAASTLPATGRRYLARHGRPIRYGYVAGALAARGLPDVFATGEPGSAEMPSAGRPFTRRWSTELVTRGVRASRRSRCTPASRRSRPASRRCPSASRCRPRPRGWSNATARPGGRVVAVGTTVDPGAGDGGRPGRHGARRRAAGPTWCSARSGRPGSVDGLVTGWHEPRGQSTCCCSRRSPGREPRRSGAYAAALRERLPVARVRRQRAAAPLTPDRPRTVARNLSRVSRTSGGNRRGHEQWTMTVTAVTDLHPRLRRLTFAADEFGRLRGRGARRVLRLAAPDRAASRTCAGTRCAPTARSWRRSTSTWCCTVTRGRRRGSRRRPGRATPRGSAAAGRRTRHRHGAAPSCCSPTRRRCPRWPRSSSRWAPDGPGVRAVVELPDPSWTYEVGGDVEVEWRHRGDQPPGSCLRAGGRSRARPARLRLGVRRGRRRAGGAPPAHRRWRLDRRRITFSGYWRPGLTPTG